jgi:hypothetical protein
MKTVAVFRAYVLITYLSHDVGTWQDVFCELGLNTDPNRVRECEFSPL